MQQRGGISSNFRQEIRRQHAQVLGRTTPKQLLRTIRAARLITSGAVR